MALTALWREDFRTHNRLWGEPGFWAIAVHRLGRRVDAVPGGVRRDATRALYRALSTGVDWAFGIRIPQRAELGRRVRIWHSGCVLLDARRIGNDVHVRHNTTFGPVREATGNDLPEIEDGVELGSGVCVLGGVTVGRGAHVAANSVVLRSLPPGVLAMGVPARVVPA